MCNIQKHCVTGSCDNKQCDGYKKRTLNEDDCALLKDFIEEDPTATLKELKLKVLQATNKNVCIETIRNAIDSFEYSLKRVNVVVAETADTEEL